MVEEAAQRERMQAVGINDPERICNTPELAHGENIVFAHVG